MRVLLAAFVTLAACGPSPELVSAPVDAPQIELSNPDEPVPTVAERPDRECAPEQAPPPRREANELIVESPVRFPAPVGSGRLRTHVHGPLSRGTQRVWGGPEVPVYVPLGSGTKELFVLDRVGNEDVALYRDPYGASSCDLRGSKNCAFEVRVFHCSGATIGVLPLERFLSRRDHLEVQDVRYEGGVVYFNEACQSYSREAKGQCSSLVAVDLATQRVLWRTPPLQSNNMFLIAGDYLVAAYGFTGEPSQVSLLRRSDGSRVASQPLPSSHDGLILDRLGMLRVGLYSMEPDRWFRIDGLRGARPRLVAVSAPPDAAPWRKPRVYRP